MYYDLVKTTNANILMALEGREVSIKDLSREVKVTSQYVSQQVVKTWKTYGIIDTIPEGSNGKYLIKLTKKGVEVSKKLLELKKLVYQKEGTEDGRTKVESKKTRTRS